MYDDSVLWKQPRDPHLLTPKGFAASGVAAGIKRSGKRDVGLLVCTTEDRAVAAAAFSRNRVVSVTVTVGREHTADGHLRAVVVNSGNANSCTGPRGEKDARDTTKLVGELLGCEPADVLPSSTGIIGHHLPMPKLLDGVRAAHGELGTSIDHARAFGEAIVTTDLCEKHAGARGKLDGESFVVAGCCKGSGMIGPMMAVDGPQATMLAYVTTDVTIDPAVLRGCVARATERTFNRTTIDGHASTNDTLLVLASGGGDATVTEENVAEFERVLTEVCDRLTYQIAADGEGATKAVTIRVTGGRTEAESAALAMAIAESPLVKTALHGNDPNWGRIVSMAGKAAARDDLGLDPDRCTLSICGDRVYADALPLDFDAESLSEKMKAKHVEIVFDAGVGQAEAHVYTCDLSREYITINADYHT